MYPMDDPTGPRDLYQARIRELAAERRGQTSGLADEPRGRRSVGRLVGLGAGLIALATAYTTLMFELVQRGPVRA